MERWGMEEGEMREGGTEGWRDGGWRDRGTKRWRDGEKEG